MQITIPLTLTLEVPTQDAAEQYLNTDGTVKDDFIADLYDNDTIYFILYGDDTLEVSAICGKTAAEVKTALATRIP